jgi:transposase-like protein
VAREVDVHPRLLRAWVASARPGEGREGVKPVGGPYQKLRQENQQLKQALAEKLLEVDFFKGALQTVAARRQRQDKSGETASMPTSGK